MCAVLELLADQITAKPSINKPSMTNYFFLFKQITLKNDILKQRLPLANHGQTEITLFRDTRETLRLILLIRSS